MRAHALAGVTLAGVTALIGVFIAASVAACTAERHPPARPLLVPQTAAWAGGADGGAWIDCWRASDVEHAKDNAPHTDLDDRFDCRVYDEGGGIQMKARFRMMDVERGPSGAQTLKPTADPRRTLRYGGWDGCRILVDDSGNNNTHPDAANRARVMLPEKALTCAEGRCSEHCA
jgi:hypothetical protein